MYCIIYIKHQFINILILSSTYRKLKNKLRDFPAKFEIIKSNYIKFKYTFAIIQTVVNINPSQKILTV